MPKSLPLHNPRFLSPKIFLSLPLDPLLFAGLLNQDTPPPHFLKNVIRAAVILLAGLFISEGASPLDPFIGIPVEFSSIRRLYRAINLF
jgi:hypothetical protein